MIIEFVPLCLITEQQINVAKKPETVQKIARAVVKPQPQPQQPHEVIVISSDTNEVAKAKQDQRDHDASKKKVTYSFVLNARSKVRVSLVFQNRHLNMLFVIYWLHT